MILISILILFIFWGICNYIVKKLLQNANSPEEIIISAVKYRKTIMFNIITLILLNFFDITIFTFICIIYYIIIAILEGILLITSLITNVDFYLKEKTFEKDIWLLIISKSLNEIGTILMIVISNVLYKT